MIFRVPLPYRECSSQKEAHGHWVVAAKARAQYRRDVHQELMVAMRKVGMAVNTMTTPTPQTVSLAFCTKGSRAVQRYAPRDEPNAVGAFKAGFDAMVVVGLLVDDSAKWMRLERTRIDSTRGPYVEIEVRDA